MSECREILPQPDDPLRLPLRPWLLGSGQRSWKCCPQYNSERDYIVLGDPFTELYHRRAKHGRDVGNFDDALRFLFQMRSIRWTEADAYLFLVTEWDDHARAGRRN